MVCFLIAFITVQQVCALAALTVIKHRLEGKNPIGEADLKWIFARNLPCIRRKSPGEVSVGVRALNSYALQISLKKEGNRIE